MSLQNRVSKKSTTSTRSNVTSRHSSSKRKTTRASSNNAPPRHTSGDVWELHMDKKTKIPFYHNVVTGKSVWSLPDDVWHKARDLDSGRFYYFNLRRQQSTWAEPENYVEENFSKCYVMPYDRNTLGLGGERANFDGFIPSFDPSKQTHFWHNKNHSVWEKPIRTEYRLDTPDTKTLYESLETKAKLLQSIIHRETDELSRLDIIEEQMVETAVARGKAVKKIKGEKRTSSKKVIQKGGGVTRYLEASLGRVGLRASVRTHATETVDSFLRSVPLFHNLDEEQFQLVRKSLGTQSFQPKEVIIRQDTRGDLLYLIQEGTVRIYRAGVYTEEQGLLEEDTVFGKMVNELIAGDYFGEQSLLTDRMRSATIVAVSRVVCLTLHREIFKQVINSDDALVTTSNSALTHSNDEVSSFAKHINNYECLLSLKRKLNTVREQRVAESLMKLMTAFSPELNVEDTILRMSKTLYGIFGCERIGLYYVDWDRRELALQIGKDTTVVSIPIGKGIAGHCAAINKIVNVPHVEKSEHFYGQIDDENGFKTRSVLCCPVCSETGTVIAVIQLINKRGGAPFSEEDEHVIASVSEQMSMTLLQKKAEDENDHSLQQYLPIWKMEEKFSVNIKRFLGTSLPGHLVSDTVIVSVSIFYAGEVLAETKWVQAAAERLTPYMVVRIEELVTLDVKLQNLPRAARVIFNVYYSKESSSEDILKGLDSLDTINPDDVKAAIGSSTSSSFGSVPQEEDSESFSTGGTLDKAYRRRQRQRKARKERKEKEEGSMIKEETMQDFLSTPIGWAGCHIFDFDQILRTGHLRLKLFRGECTSELAAVTTLLSDTTRTHVDFLELEFPKFEKPVLYTDYVTRKMQDATVQPKSHIYKMIKKEIDTFIHQDPLKRLTHDQKLLVLQARHELMSDPEALPKFLMSIEWNNRASIQLAYKLLNRWATPDPLIALQLLDYHFPDPKVRALAVSSLESLSDSELQLYMLQLTQVLKFERFLDSALSRFLLRRALLNPQTTGQQFFWYLKAEMHVKEVKDRYGALLDAYLRHCRGTRSSLGHQQYILNKLENVSRSLVSLKQKERTAYLKDQLRKLVLPESFQLPISPDIMLKTINIHNAKVMNSKKAPLMLEFASATPGADPVTVLFKAGDDLRQDQLTLQVLRIMNNLWEADGLDMRMSCYGCVSTGDQTGMIQVVPNAETLAKITAGKGKTRLIKAVKVFDEKALKKYLSSSNYARKVYEQNFVHSCAGYCVATYVLGIGDRHNDNILLSKDGRLIHIDFGHFLGNFKSKFGVKRERSPFIFTPQFLQILGGKTDKPLYKQFEHLCFRAFNVLRRNANLLITLFSLMLSCGIPELKTEQDIGWLREKLMLEASEGEAAAKFKLLIQESLNSVSTQLNDFAHIYRRG